MFIDILIMLAKVVGATLFVVGAVVPVMIWGERRAVARIQQRYGPNRCGPLGLLQPIADVVKLAMKEKITPVNVDRGLYLLAPALAAVPAFMGMLFIPYSVGPHGFVTRLPVSLLFVLGISSLQVYGLFLAGWASNSKYPLLGSLRTSAQMISYELSLATVALIPALLAGSLDLVSIVDNQRGGIVAWHAMQYFPLGLLPFIMMIIIIHAETNRNPFDLPEAESELVGGYHTEYSSMKFATFFMAEYAAMWNMAALTVVLYLGAWTGPFVEELFAASPILGFLLGCGYFVAKTAAFMLLFVWVRGTLPRLRYDQLMNFGWKGLLPAALGVAVLMVALRTFWY
ncbi:MAG: NADH-quinone oxidoreductase subunit H [Armatimonadia bacterium]|nr:NADH-quinone oxidoreductase subunit H [Armatimonadia bacterium]